MMSVSDYIVSALMITLFYVITWVGVLEYNLIQHEARGITIERKVASEGYAKEVILFILGTISGYIGRSELPYKRKNKLKN